MMVNTRAITYLALLFLSRAGAQNCPVSYDRWSKGPLLFGGVQQACQTGCTNRTDDWGQRCAFAFGSEWGMCTQHQTDIVKEYTKEINGAALELSPCDLFTYLEGRTLWLIGDSHTKAFYRALQCFLVDFWDHQECESNTDAQAVQDLANLPQQAGGSRCFHLLGDRGGRVCLVQAVLAGQLAGNKQVARGGVLNLLRDKFARPEDIFYISVGTWHEKSTGWWSSYRPGLHAVGKYYKANQDKWPHLLFREEPASHEVDAKTGQCSQARGLTYNAGTGELEVSETARLDKWLMWSLGQTTNSVAEDVLAKTYSIYFVPSFSFTVPLNAVHAGKAYEGNGVDCLHYCQPGVPQLWIYYMYRAFTEGRASISPLNGSTTQKFTCVPSYTFQ